MFRTALMRGVSAGAMTLVVASSAAAQVGLPTVHISAARRGAPVSSAPASPRTPAPQGPAAPAQPAAQPDAPQEAQIIEAKQIVRDLPPTADTSQLLRDVPGVSMYEAGGVSRLPAIHGMADDRLNILLGGIKVTSACANHMNPPLSYIDPNNVGKIEVYSGVMPVSRGGDSIGGTIVVEPKSPVFLAAAAKPAAPAQGAAPVEPGLGRLPFWPLPEPGQLRFGPNGGVLATGAISAFFRGNNNGITVSGTANVATENWSLLYNGAWSRATNYHAGNNGPKVLSTGFISENHSATLAYQNNGHYLSLRGAIENIPYQGFPNQRMDMTKNKGYTAEGKYQGAFAWGSVDARAYWHKVDHEMNFLADKLYYRSPGWMPMATVGADYGYAIKTEIPFTQISGNDLLRLGSEFHGFQLNDWWEPVPKSMMMGPLTFWNVNNGYRNRIGHYAEWEAQWTPKWSTLLGVRNDTVWMNTGPAAPYDWRNPIPMGMMGMANPDANAAALFNARNRARTDVNFDMTALARYQPDETSKYEFGYSRKTRSPNLYERYAWGVGNMAMAMVNWFGDANGYTGNVDLKPEVAHTFGVTASWRAPNGDWEARINPFYSYVENYIDADRVGNFGGVPYPFQRLQFRNHKAELYGVDASGRYKLFEHLTYGRVTATAVVNYVFGRNLDTGHVGSCQFGNVACYTAANLFSRGGDGLYHIMPLNARLGLEHRLGGWFSSIDVQLVDSKTHVSTQRNELKTSGYALLNLRTGYEWANARIDLGVENVTDALYSPPLGGFYFTGFKASNIPSALPGIGRNFYAGLTVKF